MPFFPVHYHPHLNLFAAWDALIIPATLSPNGMDINIYLNPLTCALRPAALCDWFDRATLRFHWLSSLIDRCFFQFVNTLLHHPLSSSLPLTFPSRVMTRCVFTVSHNLTALKLLQLYGPRPVSRGR